MQPNWSSLKTHVILTLCITTVSACSLLHYYCPCERIQELQDPAFPWPHHISGSVFNDKIYSATKDLIFHLLVAHLMSSHVAVWTGNRSLHGIWSYPDRSSSIQHFDEGWGNITEKLLLVYASRLFVHPMTANYLCVILEGDHETVLYVKQASLQNKMYIYIIAGMNVENGCSCRESLICFWFTRVNVRNMVSSLT